MIKYFCDKCNRELENYDIFTVTVTPPEIRRWDDNARTGTGILCRECWGRFEGWIGINLIRCKECKHFERENDYCSLHEMGIYADDYCSYGRTGTEAE